MAYVKKVKEENVEPTQEVKAEVVDTQPEAQSIIKTEQRKKKQIDKDLEVECRSVTNSGLTYVSRRTHAQIDWDNYGDIAYIDVAELLTMKSSQPRFLNEPWIIIDDVDVADHLGLTPIYEKIAQIDNVENLLTTTSHTALEDIISKLPKGIKELIADKAREMVAARTLYDIRVMDVLNKALNIDLTMIQE